MKLIFTITLILIGMMGAAQDPPQLLEVHCKPAGEDTTFLKYDFVYNEDGLYTVTFTDEMTGDSFLKMYLLDTLKNNHTDSGLFFYDYKKYEKKIYEDYNNRTIKYNVNSDFEITDYFTYFDDVWYSYDYEWASGNLQNIQRNDTQILFCSYTPNYRNPFYDMNKTFRVNPWGSYDFPAVIWDDINDTNLINIEIRGHIEGYPTEIDYYDKWDNLLYTEYFIYDVNLGTNIDIPLKPYEVLSVDYYDLLGRKIPKPTSGFYIKRETTNKGISSTKHYTP